MFVVGDIPTSFSWRGPGLLLPDAPCNFVVRMQTRAAHYPEHDGYLSLKFATGGRELYRRDGRTVAVEDGRYLLLNHGQRYASTVEQDSSVDSLAVFFDPVFASDVLDALSKSSDRLLDPAPGSTQSIRFFDHLYELQGRIAIQLEVLQKRLSELNEGPEALEGWFARLLELLLWTHRGLKPEIDRVDALKPSTRAELYRRLGWGRDYLETCYADPVSVADAAKAACLSRYRFLRLFRAAFGITPHQYLMERRLHEAGRLLRQSDLSVTDICLQVGFQSLGSFSSLFKSRFGASPTAFRRLNT